jgi:hypothetical protein
METRKLIEALEEAAHDHGRASKNRLDVDDLAREELGHAVDRAHTALATHATNLEAEVKFLTMHNTQVVDQYIKTLEENRALKAQMAMLRANFEFVGDCDLCGHHGSLVEDGVDDEGRRTWVCEHGCPVLGKCAWCGAENVRLHEQTSEFNYDMVCWGCLA